MNNLMTKEEFKSHLEKYSVLSAIRKEAAKVVKARTIMFHVKQ